MGILTAPMLSLRSMLAASSSFVDWLGPSVTPAERIYLIGTAANTDDPRYALIDIGEAVRERNQIFNGVRFEQSESEMGLFLKGNVTESATEQTAALEFLESVEGIWTDLELAAKAMTENVLPITRISIMAPPVRIESNRRERFGDEYQIVLSIAYGTQPGS